MGGNKRKNYLTFQSPSGSTSRNDHLIRDTNKKVTLGIYAYYSIPYISHYGKNYSTIEMLVYRQEAYHK